MFEFLIRSAHAAENAIDEIVTCSGLDCSLCKMLEMVTRALDFATGVSFAVAVLFGIIGGFIYIGSRGNETWMSLAKRTVKWALTGFALVLLANLAIRIIFQVTGATNKNIWDKFECNEETASGVEPNYNQISPADLGESIAIGGILGGNLEGEFNPQELNRLIADAGNDNLLFFGVNKNGQEVPLFLMGGKNGDLDVFYTDNDLLRDKLQNPVSYQGKIFSILTSEARALVEEQDKEKKVAYLSQVINQIMKKGNKMLVFALDKPPGLSETLNNLQIEDLFSKFDHTANCFNSGGVWYRFKEPCYQEKEKCAGTKCVPLGEENYVDGCKCSKNKCAEENVCVNK